MATPWVYAPQPANPLAVPVVPKLAPISVPTFSGDWKQWPTFIGLFDSLIESNAQLAPIQKLQYLHNYLRGEARDFICHISVTNENYSRALQLLRDRYDNPRRLCDELVSNLLDTPKMEFRSLDGLLRIQTMLSMTLHGLQQQRYDISSWDPIITVCITRKFDAETRQKFEESLDNPRLVPTVT